ncbi:MAG: hypothetical protein ISS71_05790 [Phycisphaerae bacterium]|nr:hypothetical protein [Phycisphaerae bacterium]
MSMIASVVRRILGSWYLPPVLAVLAILFMFPSLKSGLVMDDLTQRVPQLDPSVVPDGLYQTGGVPDNCGTLGAVVLDTFGFPRDPGKLQLGKEYGVLPWWFGGDVRCSLWRPLTAFTHWVDYRLFPNRPVLMHAHNIAIFAGIVFLVTIIYRRLIGPTWVAGLAGLMFVLDPNTYFPVMFVANRGFMLALLLGLLCLYAHHQWRSEQSPVAAVLSFVFFTLSIIANEAGVSTFAFILAYAIVLDKAGWKKRLLTVLAFVLIIVIWRIVYQMLGYGVYGIGAAYLDPGRDPLRFLYYLPGYFTAVIGSQLSGVPTDTMIPLSMKWIKVVSVFYIIFTPIALLLLLPVIRKNRQGCFWLAVMLFAAVPIVACPSGKNFGFVAVGAFGLIAVFVADIIKGYKVRSFGRFYFRLGLCFCVILLLVHIPRAAAVKVITAKAYPRFLTSFSNPGGLNELPVKADSKLFILNAASQLSICAMPFNAAYYDRPIPAAIHALGFAGTGIEVTRRDESTLMIKSVEDSIFDSDQHSVMHFSHAFAILNRLFYPKEAFAPQQTFELKDMAVTIETLGSGGLPREVSFTFKDELEDSRFLWLRFNWYNFAYEPVELPGPGQTLLIEGPPVVRFRDAVKFVTQ